MKKLLVLLIALSACGDDNAHAPDAAQQVEDATQHVADAAIDAPAAPPDRGCMGNLPASRTITINTGDPIPPNLINEIQDQIIGGKRTQFSRTFYPKWILQQTGLFVGGVNPSGAPPVWVSNGAVEAFFDVPFEDGDRIIGFTFETYGNGTVDLIQFGLSYSSSMSGAGGIIAPPVAILNVGPAWTTRTATVTPTALIAGGVLIGQFEVNAAAFCIGEMVAIFDRL